MVTWLMTLKGQGRDPNIYIYMFIHHEGRYKEICLVAIISETAGDRDLVTIKHL